MFYIKFFNAARLYTVFKDWQYTIIIDCSRKFPIRGGGKSDLMSTKSILSNRLALLAEMLQSAMELLPVLNFAEK